MAWTKTIAALLTAGALSACSTWPSPGVGAASSPATVAARPAEVKSLLWVGNSFFYYNNSMHGHVGRLLTSAGGKGFRASSATISGSGLNWHDVGAHLRADSGLGSYSFVGDNEVRFNPKGEKKFDAVMMMDCSQCPIHPQLGPLFHEFVGKHSATARSFGTEPILFMSWAYSDKLEMTGPLAAEYVKAGKAHNALVVPAGLAFAESVKRRPEVSLMARATRALTSSGTSFLSLFTNPSATS